MGEFPRTAGWSLAELGPGSRVAGYRLDHQVGAGGMAVVFLARDERLNRQIAVKLLAPALAADEAFRQRFLHESQAAAAVDHPHIIPVHDAGETDGVLFIAMRYVPGGDVLALISRTGPLAPVRVAAMISQVASALDAAHAAGLVHRDVKPGNMLVDTRAGRADHVYLSDFGLSKVALSPAGLTAQGQFLGTADYISPEQLAGGPVDGRADQYALACTAFELLTGAPPFRRDDALAVIHAQASEPPPALTSRRPALPPEADQVFATALAKTPADRFASCQDFADALADSLGLVPRDSGTGGNPALTHPPTEFAWSPPPFAARQPRPAAALAAGDGYLHTPLTGPGPLANSGPWAMSGPLTVSGPMPPRRGYPAPPARPRLRREMVIALVAIAVVVAGAATAGLRLLGSHRPVRLSIGIGASSALPRAGRVVYVRYRDSQDATARISGQVTDAKNGEIARLYAQPFPFHRASAPASSLTLHPSGTTASYTFQVAPDIVTRYQVELFKNSATAHPLATSATETIYVTADGIIGSAQNCRRPVCHEKFLVRVLVPPSALASEIAQRWHPYFALSYGRAQQPPTPQVLVRGAGQAQLSKPRRISGSEFGWTVKFTFPAGQRGYAWNWTACTTTREAADGIGLPAANGCGSKRVLASAPGMLASPCARYLACAAPAPGVKPAPPPAQAPATSPPATQLPVSSGSPSSSSPPPSSKPPVTVVTVNSPGGQRGTAGAAISPLQITATDSAGEALTYSATLPPGLAIATTGLITGTPTTAGTYTATVTATDTSGHSGHATFTWAINPASTTVTCNNPGDQTGTLGDLISGLPITCTDSGSLALTYSATLPPGLAIDPAGGMITGTLTTAGTYTATVTATDTSGSTGSCSFGWTVNAPTPTP